MEKKELMYEGKAKKVFSTEDPSLYIQSFKDDATAFNAKKKGTIQNKGIVNNKISSILFQLVEKKGIPTHFVKQLNDRDMLVKKLEIIKVEVTIRNVVAGGMAKMLGLEEGIVLDSPVFEYHYKHDALDDPLINDYHAIAINLATKEELAYIEKTAFTINAMLKDFFAGLGIDLIDFKLEFGRYGDEILLGDEISPDTCRFWEKGTNRKLDKDRFRRDLGGIEETYQEMLAKVTSGAV
ncbi:MAG: phosphoribosylaminoimidazolesuccinocarboxamide synthase [Candidatus Omnitrophica bacterium]|nr:phosphoribosylaminoimidazolesuccinocarboxamide synthase [Candidatus Omnitrophota bacterium]